MNRCEQKKKIRHENKIKQPKQQYRQQQQKNSVQNRSSLQSWNKALFHFISFHAVSYDWMNKWEKYIGFVVVVISFCYLTSISYNWLNILNGKLSDLFVVISFHARVANHWKLCMARDSFFLTSFLTNTWNERFFKLFFSYIRHSFFWLITAVIAGVCMCMWHENTSFTNVNLKFNDMLYILACKKMMSPILYCVKTYFLLNSLSSMMHIFSWWVWTRKTDWFLVFYGWTVFIWKSISNRNDKTFFLVCCRFKHTFNK